MEDTRFDIHAAVTALPEYRNGVDALENAAMVAQERELPAPAPPTYPCPDVLWQGGFARVADALGQQSWEIWMGAACAFGALARRHIHCAYYGSPLYGPFYGLLIKATGTGKSLCTNTFRALLPDWYSVSGAVQSGPALMPIIAEIERHPDTKLVTGCRAVAAALVIPEWTRLAKNLKLQHSTLLEDMNEIADAIAWNISRSEANKTGGGNMVLRDPLLTVCATTTESLFREEVTTRMIRSGFMNRYLILPGSVTRWKLYEPDAAGLDFHALTPLREAFLASPHSIGGGLTVWRAFSTEALARFRAWGEPLFEGKIMNNPSTEVEIYKRLHTAALRLSLIYAWADQKTTIALPHVNAAITAIDTSYQYLDYLMAEVEPYVMPSVRFEIEGKEKVAQKIQRESGTVDQRKLSQDLRKSLRSTDIAKFLRELIAEGYVKKRENRWLEWV